MIMDNNYIYKIPRIMYIISQEIFDEVIKGRYNLIRRLKDTENKRWERYSYRKRTWIADFKNNFILEK